MKATKEAYESRDTIRTKLVELQAENKSLRESMDELLDVALGVQKRFLTGEGLIVDGSMLSAIIKKAEKAKTE